MGLFDFFSSKPTPAKIAKITKKILNEHQQQQIRQEGLEELVNFGTPEAIGALVKRLGVNFRDTIKNEQEKTWVADMLVDRFGEEAVDPMKAFIREDQTISSVIMALGRIVDEPGMVSFLIETLQNYSPQDHRSMSARLQLVDALADYKHPDVVPAVFPYLLDHDDDIRIKVMDIVSERVERNGENYAGLLDGLVSVLLDPMASGRVTRKAASILNDLDADLSKRYDELSDYVPDGFNLGTNGRLRPA